MPGAENKEAIGSCIKETSNWSKIASVHKFDHKDFSKEAILKDIETSAPKLKALMDKIIELDSNDIREHKRLYKHFIYSDIKSSYGAKLIASALYAYGFEHAYHVGKTQRGLSFQLKMDTLNHNQKNVFATLTSVSFFEKPIGINFRKELLKVFNSRPDNIYGDKIRIIILDSGFREGVDLFDVKYAHLFEPIITVADEKQAIGRVTRYCGQKGLEFHPSEGWPVQVFRYETIVPKAIRKILHVQYPDLAPSETFFQMFMKFSNVDPKKITFANELEKISVRAAVDYELTRNIHEFKIGGGRLKYYGGNNAGDKFKAYQDKIQVVYKDYKWPPIKVENGCTGAPIPQAVNEDELKEEETEYFSPENRIESSVSSKGGALILPFTPTQDFIRHYFTPKFEKNGLLLWHSVGTGKTCTAIATASSSFERENYTIVYVTRHTLKGDVWKNMFDQVCSSILQERIAEGLELPEAQAQRMRLLGGRWIEPMSYRQFSNMLDGKSRLYEDLVKRNGKKDPLRKTLVIIDEAHKMFAPDVTGTEKPDIDVIKKAFNHSMQVSGKDGVRLLFMTATPYTSNPMDLIKILNLLRPLNDKLPEEFDVFAQEYLNEQGEFSPEGKLKYWDAIVGYISYLNREKDIRTFSYAKLHEIQVPMSNYEFDSAIRNLIYQDTLVKDSERKLGYAKQVMQQDIHKLKSTLDKEFAELVATHEAEIRNCIAERGKKHDEDKKRITKNYDQQISICKKMEKKCIDDLKKIYQEAVKQLKAKAVEDKRKCDKKDKECPIQIKKKLNDALEDLKNDLEYDSGECKSSSDIQKCIQTAKSVFQRETEAIEKHLKFCNDMKQLAKDVEKRKQEEHGKKIEQLKTQLQKTIQHDEDVFKRAKNNFKTLQEVFQRDVEGDRSQRKRLEHCLGVTPAYRRMLRNDPAIMDIELESGPMITDEEAEAYSKALESEGVLQNVYFVSGHGSERVETFSKRVRMPKDKILIVFPVCARPNYMSEACLFLNEFQKPEHKKLFMDPLRNRDKIMRLIKQPIRIYLPGEKVPNLSTNLFLNFDKQKTVIMKSGVYRIGKIPTIDNSRFSKATYNLGSDKCNDYIGEIESPMHYNRAIHYEVFKGNLFAPLKEKASYNTLMYNNFTLQHIMQETGPGVYYYVGCRSSHQNIQPDMYERVFQQSQEQQEEANRSQRNKELMKFVVRDKEGVVSPIESPPSNPTPPKPSSKDKKMKDIKIDPEKFKEFEEREKKLKEEREKKKQTDNTREEKEQLKIMMEEIEDWEEMLYASTLNPDVWSSLDDKITQWVEVLSNMKQTQRVKNVQIELEIFNEMRLHKDKADIDYNIHEEKHKIGNGNGNQKIAFKVIYKSYVFKHKKYVRRLNSQLVGIIPSNEKDATQKCTSDILVKRIKKVMQAGLTLTLPTKPSDWENNKDGLFNGLCEESKRVWKQRQI
jgi:hypothetical protein